MAPKTPKTVAPVSTNATPAVAAPVAQATPAVAPAPAQAQAPAQAAKSTSKKPAAPKAAEATPVATAVVAPAPAAASKSTSKKSATPAPASAPVAVAPAKTEEASAAPATSEEPSVPGERRKPTKDTLNAEYEKIRKWIDEKLAMLTPPKEEATAENGAELKKKRKRANKGLGIKDVRFLKKSLEQMQKDHIKVSKIKNTNRKNNTSGLKLPVKLSKDLYDFCGLEHDSLHSRVDVNKILNAYVKEKGLQDNDDKRKIYPDAKLKALLGLEANHAAPIQFWELTQRTAHHFPESVNSKKKAKKPKAPVATA